MSGISKVFYSFIFLLSCITGFSQTDDEFWFVVPEVTVSHCGGATCPGGEPVYFRVSALGLPSTVRIYQPARPAGFDTTFYVPANTTVSIDATPWIGDLENSPGGIILDKGIHITSTNLITVYYDEDEYYNRDIFALKGKNALGYEFYTPFNDVWRNGNYNPIQPYSSIDVVATEDNTLVTITPSADIVGGHPAGISFNITLNRGETYSCVTTTQLAADHLGGTHIVSNKPIAVSLKDDSVWAEPKGCKDLVGDQTVPLRRADNRSIVGYEYIVMRGKINLTSNPLNDGDPSGERVFIMATQPNTEVFIDGASYANLANPGQQVDFELLYNSTHIEGDKPIMILHVSGFGCEFGGAVLPTIDGCTGSLEVSFTRSTDQSFYLNIMTTDPAKNAFTMHYEDGSTFDIPGSWFEPVGATGFVCLKDANKLFVNATGGGVPQDQVVKITNSASVFHLGLIEGGSTTGCKYGYFSDYAESRGSVIVVETGSQSVFRCFGDTAQLMATGGLTYTWTPSDYLSDPFIANPLVAPPPGVYNYTVTLTRPCFPDTSFTIIVGIAPEVEAYFEMDKWYICAPDTVTIDNQSFGVDMSDTLNTQWDFDLDDPFNGYVYDTNAVFQHVFTNTTDSIQQKTIQLIVWNQQGCIDEFQRDIMIRPEITGGFTTDVTDGCQPVTVNFTNTSTGNTDRYKWTFGDGNSSNAASPVHTYYNIGMADSIYHVEMVAISPFYCTDTVETDISVYPYLEADFAIDTFQGCSPLIIGIDNNSAGYIEEYEWTFGDGTSSNTSASSFTHTYINTTSSPIQRTIQLVVKNNTRGCTDTISRIISVFPEVTADFTQDTIAGCHGLEVNFTNQSSLTATLFDWDFGDGGSSTVQDPLHLFENMTLLNVDYTVRLVSTTPNLCRDTSYQTIRIHPYILADFSVNDFQGCAPFEITLENASEGAISQYEWDWGDGSPTSSSSGATLTHVYQNSSSAPVINPLQLVVENADGCSDTLIRDITVFPVVVSQFTQDITEGCNPLDVQFTNQSNSVATSFMWEFGDGGSSTDVNPTHEFQNLNSVNVTYNTRLIAYSDQNCTDTSDVDIDVYSYLKADFTMDQASNCTPFNATFTNSSVGGVRYHWDFGDGNDTTVLNKNQIAHQYNNLSPATTATYEVVLTAWNADSCMSELRRDVIVYPIVNANFSADVTDGCHPLTVQFTNNSTSASTYNWDFGNGQSSDEENPTMIFENFSLNDTTFNVQLVSTNSQSCTDTLTVPVLVHPFVEADFTIEYTSQCTPFDVTINNSSINGQQYTWSFNGTPYTTTSTDPITRQFQNNDYTNSETFTIDLLVTSPHGCTSSLSREIKVFHKVEASFTSITEGCHPLIVDFTNNSQGGDEYNWEFGDNGSSIVESPVHTYTNIGDNDSVYNIKLLVTSEDQCRDSIYGQVIVHAKPKARFIVDNSVDCPPFELTIQNVSEAGDIYNWNFGDGSGTVTTTNLNSVNHTYSNDTDETQTYALQLDVESVHGCTDTITQNINVYPSISVDFERDSAGCSPFLSEFSNNSVRAFNYEWDFGDGTSSSLTHPTHTYFNNSMNDEVYDVKLKGISKFGCIDSVTKQVTVYPSPIAEFDATPVYQYFPNVTVYLTNETNDGYWNFQWGFGDGQTSILEDPGSYTYSQWGNYNISLSVSSDHCQDSISHRIRIFAPLPIAGFEPDIDSGCVPLTIFFNNNSQYGDEYSWDFDDGGSSTDFEPTHTFTESGLYQVRLIVKGEGGNDIYFKEVKAFRKPNVNFKVAPTLVMLPDQPIKVFNFSEYGIRYLWNFGDGNTSTEKDSVHLYSQIGVFDISLTVWTEHGCVDSLVIPEAVTVMGKGSIQYPNAFFPNPNGPNGGYYSLTDINNEVFFPFHDGVIEYRLQIFNRWGEFIFESIDINIGWDGYYKGALCKQDVYVYKATGTFSNGKKFILAGDVTLLRKD